jgi:hypothetical protein
MIRLNDAALLASTKLHTRRARTGITVVISGLLFAGLIGLLIVAVGAQASIKSFSGEGLNSRYIVATQPDQPNASHAFSDPATLDRAQQLYDQTVVAKKLAAKKFDVAYDSSADSPPVFVGPAMGGQLSTRHLKFNTSFATQAIQEYASAHPDPGLLELMNDAKGYAPSAFYQTTLSSPNDGQLQMMQNGQESFGGHDQQNTQKEDVLQNNGLELTDGPLISPFLLSHYRLKPGNIPVVVTYSEAEQLIGLTPLAKSVSSQQKLDRISQLFNKAENYTFAACYRNSVSSQQIQTAITQAQELSSNKNNKDYQAPTLMYGLPPADACAPATTLHDTRTVASKTTDDNQATFNKLFGQIVDPIQQKLLFQIIGLKPDQSADGSKTTINGLLQSVVGSSTGNTVSIPSSLFGALSHADTLRALLFPLASTTPFGFPLTSYFVEFRTATDARSFIDHKSCTTGPEGRCGTTAKPFGLRAYGSNNIALEDLQTKFVHIFELGVLVITVIALVVMGGAIGGMIADGKREAAVFRAIGANRGDVVIIYSLYTLYLSVAVAVFAGLAGLVIALAFDRYMWQSTTVQARLLFGAAASTHEFHFLGLPLIIWPVLLLPIVCGFVSMAVPLLRSVHRSPLKDMRDQ